jgi:hypothetical protein
MAAPLLTATFSWLRQLVGGPDAEVAEFAAAGSDTSEKLEDYGPDPYRQLLQILLPIEAVPLDSQQTMRVLSVNQRRHSLSRCDGQ